ncbi:hypothetical protein GME_15185 [Halomonas sp. TD01]|nr:hypothetical protein GME_15185 [Halomonas sp. TD01]
MQVAAAVGVFESDVGHGGSYTATLPPRKVASGFLGGSWENALVVVPL